MKKLILSVLFLGAIFASSILTGCGGATDTTDTDTKDSVVVEKPKPIPADAVFLSGLYATSTNTPYSEFSPENLFDGTEKYWATMPNAGPDEGVMMYFDGVENIASMEVKYSKAEGLNKETQFKIYVNGSFVDLIAPSNPLFKGFTGPVNSIYLRITGAVGVTSLKGSVGNVEYDDYDYTVNTYSGNSPMGIEEIIFKDKDGKKINVMPLKSLAGKVTASSTLIPVEAYTADFLFDSRYDFGWAEGNKDGSGKDEIIKITFGDEQNISKLKLWNGFHRSTVHYNSNARVKQFEFGTTGNMATYTLKDEMVPQEITLQKPLKGKEFVFKVLDIYPGTSYKDLVISEIQLYSDYGWSAVNTGGMEQRKLDMIAKVKSTVLEKILDKWFYEARIIQGNEEIARDISIILRSNQSFVIWHEERINSSNTISTNTVYDGNWELVSATKTSATVKIFGKRQEIMEGYGAYKGRGKTDQVTIFSDVLTITDKEIKGTKFIEQFFLK